jgi:hypothetical protein
MLNVYAQTFMTATRSNCVQVQDLPATPKEKRLNWFFRPKTRCIDLKRL